jgi:hypothetical protein
MIGKFALALGAALMCSSTVLMAADTPGPTVIQDKGAYKKLLGQHKMTLQWISWDKDKAGLGTVEERNGTLYLSGQQTSNETSDKLMVDGIITSVSAKTFTFKGRIVTQVSYLAGGKACVRDGEYTFKITGARKFWRMQEMDNPCDPPSVDYVDLRFDQ